MYHDEGSDGGASEAYEQGYKDGESSAWADYSNALELRADAFRQTKERALKLLADFQRQHERLAEATREVAAPTYRGQIHAMQAECYAGALRIVQQITEGTNDAE